MTIRKHDLIKMDYHFGYVFMRVCGGEVIVREDGTGVFFPDDGIESYPVDIDSELMDYVLGYMKSKIGF